MSIGYKSSEEDADVCMKQDFKPKVNPYYKYIVCYVDDFLHIYFEPKEDMDALDIIYRLKEIFGPTDRYLSTNVDKVQLKDGRVVWSTNCIDYLNRSIDNADNSIGVDNMELNNYGDRHRPY